MKLLGIDYGKKRIGIALSDDGGVMAFPNTVIDNNGALEKITEIVTLNEVSKIIIGESKDYEMKDNPIMDKARKLGDELKSLNLEVDFQPEFMTSMEALKIKDHALGDMKDKRNSSYQPRQGKRGDGELVDAQAAAILLQSYIDSNKNK